MSEIMAAENKSVVNIVASNFPRLTIHRVKAVMLRVCLFNCCVNIIASILPSCQRKIERVTSAGAHPLEANVQELPDAR